MRPFERIRLAWEDVRRDFNRCTAIVRLKSGDVTVEHYKSVLRQIYYHTRENPQLQALAAVRFRGDQRKSVKRFFQHAISEIGHDQMALNDLAALGEDVRKVPFENPHPATAALIAFAFHQAEHLNPVGYLGYLFHLEFTPTQEGASYLIALRELGVPASAMTFLDEHVDVDHAHNKLMERYADELVVTDDDLSAVLYAMRATGYLYGEMLRAALEAADTDVHFGVAAEEAKRSGSSTELAVLP